MYESYYGLTEKPFSVSPDPRFLFPCGIHQAAFEVLEHAWQRGEGVVAFTGDARTGKTTLCRTMLERLDRRTFGALVLDPMLSDDELLKLMLQDFGVVSRDEFTRGETRYVSTEALFDTLRDFLLSLRPLGASAVLIVDEAQNLRPRVLDQIRILSNLEVDKKKLLEVVLVGRPTRRARRRGPVPLAPWVSITHELRPLSREEAAAYVRHRVAIASGGASAREARVVFQPQALHAIHRLSDGIPRTINPPRSCPDGGVSRRESGDRPAAGSSGRREPRPAAKHPVSATTLDPSAPACRLSRYGVRAVRAHRRYWRWPTVTGGWGCRGVVAHPAGGSNRPDG